METLNERIRSAREAAVLSQGELAAAAGISQNTLSQIENGRTTPRPSTIRKIAIVLGVPASHLVQGSGRSIVFGTLPGGIETFESPVAALLAAESTEHVLHEYLRLVDLYGRQPPGESLPGYRLSAKDTARKVLTDASQQVPKEKRELVLRTLEEAD